VAVAPSPCILPAASRQISPRVRRFPSGSQGAQTGPRGLAGGGTGKHRAGAHVPLPPTRQRESPSAVNFSAPSHSSQPVPRQAIFCLIPRSISASRTALKEWWDMPARSLSNSPLNAAAWQALCFQSVQCQFIPGRLGLPGYQPPDSPLQQRHFPQGEIHGPAVDAQGSRHQGLK